MKQKVINLYSFEELSEDGKQRAKEIFFKHENFYWITSEASKALEIFCDIFSINIYQFDFQEPFRSEWKFNLDNNILSISGLKLYGHLYHNYYNQITKGKYYGKLVDTFPNSEKIPISKEHPIGKRHVKRYSKITREMDNCPFTGICYDCDLLGPIIDFLKNPSDKIDFDNLLRDCLYSLAHTVSSEIDAQYDNENFSDFCNNNEYTFNKDGKIEN